MAGRALYWQCVQLLVGLYLCIQGVIGGSPRVYIHRAVKAVQYGGELALGETSSQGAGGFGRRIKTFGLSVCRSENEITNVSFGM